MADKHEPTFSVIMPSYNHERYIGDAIESVLNQSYGDLELIIIDDASDDDSVTIIKKYQSEDSRIRAYFHSQNLGIARTMNEAISKASGDYIALTASDDVWLENKLRDQIQILERDSDLVLWSDGWIIDAEGNRTGETFLEKHGALERKKSGNIFNELISANYIFGASVVARREYFQEIGYDTSLKFLNDYKVMLALARKRDFYFMNEPVACYRIHEENTIIRDIQGIDWLKDSVNVSHSIIREYKEHMTRPQLAEKYRVLCFAYYRLGCYKESLYYLPLAVFSDWKYILKKTGKLKKRN